MNKNLIVITGPTAVGKTDIAISVAKHFNTEIISCDSRQMYKELSIGTAVPSEKQLKEVKHHFVQNISIHNYYNASMFEVETLALLNKLFKKHDVVIMTGGSGLYIDAVIKGIDDLPTIDKDIRNSYKERLKNEGIENLRIELKKKDPEYYSQVDLKNPNRILKALEVIAMTGKPYSSFLTNPKKERDFNTTVIILDLDRAELHKRIEHRVDEMIKNGLVEEARRMLRFKHNNSLNTVGYKELFDHFEGKTSLEEAIKLIKRNTRRYARRQLTWFRRYKEAKWPCPSQLNEIFGYIEKNVNM